MRRRSLLIALAPVLLAGCTSPIDNSSSSINQTETQTTESSTTQSGETKTALTSECPESDNSPVYDTFQVYNSANSGVEPQITIVSPSGDTVFDEAVNTSTPGEIKTIYETAESGSFEVICNYSGVEKRAELDVVEGTNHTMAITLQTDEPKVEFETSVRDAGTTDC